MDQLPEPFILWEHLEMLSKIDFWMFGLFLMSVTGHVYIVRIDFVPNMGRRFIQ